MSLLFEDATLHGAQGDLIQISIAVDPRHVEELLDQLSTIQFPINPELSHGLTDSARPVTCVEFPAYSGQVEEVVRALHLVNLGGRVQLGLALPIW